MTTILNYDGFDHYTTYGELLEKNRAVSGNPSLLSLVSPGRSSGQGVRISGGFTQVQIPFVAGATRAVGLAGNFVTAAVAPRVIGLTRAGNVVTSASRNVATGMIDVANNDGTIVASTPAPAYGAYHYYELKAYAHFSAGTIQLWIDGNLLVDLTGQKTYGSAGEGYYDGWNWAADGGSGNEYDVDDAYWADDRIGDVAIRWCPPTADGTYSDFTPLSSTNKSNVDDTSPDDDTSYNHDGTSGHKDTYTLDTSNLPGSGSVVAIQYVAWARKDDVGDRFLKPTMRQSSHDHDGTGEYIGMSYTYHREVSQTNPETSSAYTLSELGSSEFGYKVG